MFLDVSQAFDRVWIQGLIHKLSTHLPAHFVQLLTSYLYECQFQVHYGDAVSDVQPISAGVPQGSVLGLILYVLYTADIPTPQGTSVANFADDTAILSANQEYDVATQHLQGAVNEVAEWARKWKIEVNETKSVRVDFALRPHHHHHPVNINNKTIQTEELKKRVVNKVYITITWCMELT